MMLCYVFIRSNGYFLLRMPEYYELEVVNPSQSFLAVNGNLGHFCSVRIPEIRCPTTLRQLLGEIEEICRVLRGRLRFRGGHPLRAVVIGWAHKMKLLHRLTEKTLGSVDAIFILIKIVGEFFKLAVSEAQANNENMK